MLHPPGTDRYQIQSTKFSPIFVQPEFENRLHFVVNAVLFTTAGFLVL